MGFLYVAIKIPKAITITCIITLLHHLKFMVIGALTHLGLFKPPPEEDYSRENSINYVLILDGSSPSFVPIPVHVVTAAIKNKLPVLPYADFVARFGTHEEDGGKVCTVCLDRIDGSHEIRELCNCNHVFHRGCLDTWVDEGQVTCPLCRSMLLPPNKFLTRSGGGGLPAVMTEISGHLRGEDQIAGSS